MDRSVEASVSNAGCDSLEVWIEPWCDELTLPARSTLLYAIPASDGVNATPPVFEFDEGRLVIWSTCAGVARVTIDGELQDTGSAMIAVPDELYAMPMKSFVEAVFEGQPGTRPGGRRDCIQPERDGWIARIRCWLGRA